MLVKLGVDISRLDRPIRRALGVVDRLWRKETGHEAVVTSTYEGSHSPSSLHYRHLAFDVRKASAVLMRDKLREELGDDYDVVAEATHYHIEYDPEGK